MSRFVQLHILTSYPPSNLNRDDLGRPKTARVGGADRLRISSQSLKRAWRTSDIFQEALRDHIGTRTRRIGIEVKDRLIEKGVAEKQAREWAMLIAGQFGKLKTVKEDKKAKKEDKEGKEEKEGKEGKKKKLDEGLEIEQLAHIGPDEWKGIDGLIELLTAEKRTPKAEELELLRHQVHAADIAFFGRMLASRPSYNIDAAVQVSHAITIHETAVEDDYFTAVDDLNKGEEDSGAGHIGEFGFGSGVFYVYICINKELLLDNLSGDEDLAKRALVAFAEAAAKTAPSGKQNSFASRAYASYILAERGDQQPRSLSVAFLKPVIGKDILNSGISALDTSRRNMDAVYGKCADAENIMNAEKGEGSLKEIIEFITE